MADCEVVVRHLYSLLGRDYREEDSEVEEELQHKLPVMGLNSTREETGSRHGADAEGDPECGKGLRIGGEGGSIYSSHYPTSYFNLKQ